MTDQLKKTLIINKTLQKIKAQSFESIFMKIDEVKYQNENKL
jgi:hypothetical protein